MTTNRKAERYPRRRFQRGLLRGAGRIFLPLLTQTDLSGLQNFPAKGPLLVVGNHIAAMEVVLMVVYAPWQMELLGPGDIPPPPLMHAIAKFHGYIGINRGNLDRLALNRALDVLNQHGILGMFPEGGIWETGEKPAKRGVAWLSYHAQAPILPIGFGGLEGAMNAALKLQRPHLTMNVGHLIPPVSVPPGISRKTAMHEAAQQITQAVNRLIPDEYKSTEKSVEDERFSLHLTITGDQERFIDIPSGLRITNADALCKMWYTPAILRIFRKDLGIDVSALQNVNTNSDAEAIIKAVSDIQEYLKKDNPAFFTYRFGMVEGLAMEKGLAELKALANWVLSKNYTVCIEPIRRYRIAGQQGEITENAPGEAHSW